MPNKTIQIALALLILLSLALSACSAGGQAEAHADMAPMSAMPAEVQQAPEAVSQAYRFAVANPEILTGLPCYCGCGAMGHTSNLSCFIQDVEDDSSIAWDNHALGCGICVDIAQDVMRLSAEGESLTDIRTYVDATYSSFGPPTNTPLP